MTLTVYHGRKTTNQVNKTFSGTLQFRRARLSDKPEVLRMRQNVYRGLDYLPDYYDYFLADKHRQCIVGEIDAQLVNILRFSTILCRGGLGDSSTVYRAVRTGIFSLAKASCHINSWQTIFVHTKRRNKWHTVKRTCFTPMRMNKGKHHPAHTRNLV